MAHKAQVRLSVPHSQWRRTEQKTGENKEKDRKGNNCSWEVTDSNSNKKYISVSGMRLLRIKAQKPSSKIKIVKKEVENERLIRNGKWPSSNTILYMIHISLQQGRESKAPT